LYSLLNYNQENHIYDSGLKPEMLSWGRGYGPNRPSEMRLGDIVIRVTSSGIIDGSVIMAGVYSIPSGGSHVIPGQQ